MEKNTSPAKSGISFGVLFGVLMVLEFVIMYVIGMKSLVNTSVGLIISIANYLVLPILFMQLSCFCAYYLYGNMLWKQKENHWNN